MGQRGVLGGLATSSHRKSKAIAVPQLSVFPTELGWFGVLGTGRGILSLSIGHASADEVREAIRRKSADLLDSLEIAECDWCIALRRRLQQFTLGESQSFADCRLDLTGRTPFQQRVIAAVRRIEFGSTQSYGEVAAAAGAPRAARAVGTVMASNRTPILVPCHRVIASGGRLGGFSAPNGVNLKRRMLEIEDIQLS